MLLTGWMLALVAGAVAALTVVRSRARAELVARACHELRSPLTAARLAVHALDGPGVTAPQSLAVLDLELRRAGLALDDLAAAQDGGGGRDLAELLEAHEIVQVVADSWMPVARGLGAELCVEPVPPGLLLRGDALRLAQALGNLVGNALEHGAGPVTLRVRPGGGPSDHPRAGVPGHRRASRAAPACGVRFEVDDAGPGLPAPVCQLAARPRGGRGRRGRGLAIASSIAERHGGRVAAAPAPRGARLVLELPLLAEEHGDARAGAPLANRVPWWRRPAE